jgi:hypothetical protein
MYEKDALDVDIRVHLEELQWLGSVFENGGRPQVIITIANLEGGRSPCGRVMWSELKPPLTKKPGPCP